jgi:hypothetical protein
MSELDGLMERLARLNRLEKSIEEKKKEARAELFIVAEIDYEDKRHLLPTTTVTVPKKFWEKTGMTEQDFLDSRFPTWEIEHAEYDDVAGETTLILRKKPLFMPFSAEGDEYRLSKTTTEPTPDVDWETLSAERPDLFKKLAKPVTTFELDGDKLLELMEDDRSIQSVLMRHTKYTRQPQQRVSVKEA